MNDGTKVCFVSWVFVGTSRIFCRYICFNFTLPPTFKCLATLLRSRTYKVHNGLRERTITDWQDQFWRQYVAACFVCGTYHRLSLTRRKNPSAVFNVNCGIWDAFSKFPNDSDQMRWDVASTMFTLVVKIPDYRGDRKNPWLQLK